MGHDHSSCRSDVRGLVSRQYVSRTGCSHDSIYPSNSVTDNAFIGASSRLLMECVSDLHSGNRDLFFRDCLNSATTTPVFRAAQNPPLCEIGWEQVAREGPSMRRSCVRVGRWRNRVRGARLSVEQFEAKALLASYSVTSLADAGSGSLRAAIDSANTSLGADEIVFAVTGTIELATALPAINDTVTIDGTTAPGFAGTPEVAVRFMNNAGLLLAPSSSGSVVKSLSLVDASGPGVSVIGSRVTLEGNFIGVLTDGITAVPNRGAGVFISAVSSGNQIGSEGAGNLISGNNEQGILISGSGNQIAANRVGVSLSGGPLPNGGDGIAVEAGASGNLIGNANPVTGIDYFGTGDVSLPVQTWTGIRGLEDGRFLMTGTSQSGGVESGLLYIGPLEGATSGEAYAINYPGGTGTATSVYGPDDLGDGEVVLVGTYVLPGDATRYGFSFRGNLATMPADVADPNNYQTIWNGSAFNYVHSTMGGLAVGNYVTTDSDAETGRSFIYDLEADEFLTDIVFPGSLSNTAYGIWDNGKGSYTIAGGYSELPVNNRHEPFQPLGLASLVDYDRLTGEFSNWRSFTHAEAATGDSVTHFEGISSVEKGVYTLAADAAVVGQPLTAGLASVPRNADGSFGEMTWVEVSAAESVTGSEGVTSANSVYGNAVVGVVTTDTGAASFQARINVGRGLSNVISGNVGNGIALMGSHDNVIAMNRIGTDVTGTTAVPNGGHGILVAAAAHGNMIGGTATAGNDPTSGVFMPPPLGNLISGNAGNGVFLTSGATANTLSGNFIGTTASGNSPLGNAGDGVAIVEADGNALLGTTLRQNPFVFYNVLSGNTGNGLRITDSDNTRVQANFTGVGADNATVVSNGGDGILANGTSANTLAGGPIPMGNVTSGNTRHGIEIAEEASGFVSFNNFAGMVAFGDAAANGLDGIHITATGGGNLVRTCLVAGNVGNGIVIGGYATGVTVEDTAAGTNSQISGAIPNGGSGLVITDNAYGNAVGGFQPSVETKVHLSGNDGYGIEVTGFAHDNSIFNTVIGAGFRATDPIPNLAGGVFIGPDTSGTLFGGDGPLMANRVLFNQGTGVTVVAAGNTEIVGNEIRESSGVGLYATGDCADTRVVSNLIVENGQQDVDIVTATGITYIPAFVGPAPGPTAEILSVRILTRPALEPVLSIEVAASATGPLPVMFSSATVAQAFAQPAATTSIVVSDVQTGLVENWIGQTWVDSSTLPTSIAPAELFRCLQIRWIQPNGWVRWTPSVGGSDNARSFAFQEWNGVAYGDTTEVVVTT